MGNRGFICKRDKKDRIKKITDFFEEGRTEIAVKEKTRQPVWNDLHYTEGKTSYQQPVLKD